MVGLPFKAWTYSFRWKGYQSTVYGRALPPRDHGHQAGKFLVDETHWNQLLGEQKTGPDHDQTIPFSYILLRSMQKEKLEQCAA